MAGTENESNTETAPKRNESNAEHRPIRNSERKSQPLQKRQPEPSSKPKPSQHRAKTGIATPSKAATKTRTGRQWRHDESRNQNRDQCRTTKTTFETKAALDSEPIAETLAWPPRLVLSSRGLQIRYSKTQVWPHKNLLSMVRMHIHIHTSHPG